MLLEIIISAGLLLAWTSTIFMLKKKRINLGEFLLWSALWLGLLTVSVFPAIPSTVAKFLGIGRAVDLVIYISVFLLFFMVFKIYVRIEMQEQAMTRMVREVAIRKGRKK